MRRDANILPLSREHHYGLLFCWKIRQGLDRHVDLERIRGYVLHFWKCNLEEHFADEELLLFGGRRDTFCVEATQQHSRIRGLVQAIEGSGSWTEANYRNLASEVDHHIRFEERKVFPFLEQEMTKNELSTVGEHLAKMRAAPAEDVYADAFWS